MYHQKGVAWVRDYRSQFRMLTIPAVTDYHTGFAIDCKNASHALPPKSTAPELRQSRTRPIGEYKGVL